MADIDPLNTQRMATPEITAELEEAGFADPEEIGRGGFGVVYRFREHALDRTVAIKVLTDADRDQESHERFVREQRAMGRLTGHPNIAAVLHVATTASGHPYLVMPYFPQGSLEARITRRGPLSVQETLRLGVKMAGALATAHQLGILHRDIKPSNILITDYGEPVLIDFGIAHIPRGFHTTASTVTGSPAFTAPELLSGDAPSPAADIYGLGATLFAALTGHAAFERRTGERVVAQFLRITTEPTPHPSDHGIDDDLSRVIESAMSHDPDQRPSAVALGKVLQQLQAARGWPVDEMAVRADADGDPENVPVPLLAPTDDRTPVGKLQTARSGTGSIPLELTSFVGRRTEFTNAKSLLKNSRLVTLTGIGGVGKTRLALRVATRSQRDFADGVSLVSLGQLHEGGLLPGVIAASLGLRPQGQPTLDALINKSSTRAQRPPKPYYRHVPTCASSPRAARLSASAEKPSYRFGR